MSEDAQKKARLKEIGFILKDLLKVIKVVSTYPEDNPLPQSLKQSFSERLVAVVETFGDLEFDIDRDVVRYQGEIMFEDRGKEERLAGMFFEAGLTTIVFRDGLDVDEVYKLLAAVKTYMNSPGRELDLPTMLWEAELSRFGFQTVEDVALADYDDGFQIQEYLKEKKQRRQAEAVFGFEQADSYDAIFSHDGSAEYDSGLEHGEITFDDSSPTPNVAGQMSGRGVPAGSAVATFAAPISDYEVVDDSSAAARFLNDLAETMGAEEKPAAKTTAGSEPDTRLILNKEYRASEEDEATIRELLNEDAEFDEYESTLEIVKEMLLQEAEMNDFYESVTIAEKVLTEFIGRARLIEAGQLLIYMQDLENQLRNDRGLWAERLKDAVTTAGSRDRLMILANSLNNHQQVGVAEIKRYLDCFGWESLGNITDLLGEFEHSVHREALKDYLTARGSNNLEIISRGIFDKRHNVVCNAVSILGRIQDRKALKYLERVLHHDALEVRRELVNALITSPHEEALELLRQLVDDPDAQIRREAVQAIVKRRGTAAFEVISEIINDDQFPALNPDEQQMLLNAFSVLGSDAAVGYLMQLIKKYNLFRDSGLAFYREAAFEALCHNPGDRAQKTLIKLGGSWRPDIRRRAAAAIQHRREIVFGSE
ncbi:MAG TPA: HEAT repeat domain-containing protein [candidate division Zixibacteria bacterium]|nr:HEAT repeat domain-containing protein [candidate division Zixibacteria bacterium]